MPGPQTAGQRLVYMNAVQKLAEQGIHVSIAVLTQSYIRSEVNIVSGQNIFQFPIVTNQTPNIQANTQNLIQLQDSFVLSDLGIFLFTPAAPSSGTTAIDTTVPLLSYPNILKFSTAGSAAAAETIYHGYLTLSVNKQIVVPFWDVWRSRLVNQTQGVTSTAGSAQDQLSGRDDVFFPTEPNWVFIGSRSNILQLILPAQIPSADIQPGSRIVVYGRGLLAQNSTSVN